ncbi:MAG TPA: hypothetical protein PKU86_01945 [Bacteroidales bacterium]|nr:hypothetical protein [Bacteroidales bacterium]HQQ02059.1 hypothetical protein [Bacteroidales bacterium]
MKTQKLIFGIITALVFAGIFSLTSCNKDEDNPANNDNETSATFVTLSQDENSFEEDIDGLTDDVNSFMMQEQLKSTEGGPCHATLDSIRTINDTIIYYISYNGLNCNGKVHRTGNLEIRIKEGTFWVQPGASIHVKVINYTITRPKTGKTTVLNGEKTLTNISGGHVGLLGITYDTIIHEMTGTFQKTFDDNTTRTWNIARRKTFTGTASDIKISNEGLASIGEYTSLVCWGENRQGDDFYTQIIQPVVLKQSCDFDPVSGQKKHFIPSTSATSTITFGYNDNNQPIAEGECPTKYRLDWERNGNSGTVYLFLH